MSDDTPTHIEGAYCPMPLPHSEQVVMGHGSGGKMSHDLVRKVFLPALNSLPLRAGDDAGVVRLGDGQRLAVSTDSHVVTPLFFPNGDIGKLAVCGTVNDVAVMGAQPQYLTAGFILEEGLDMAILQRVVTSMQAAAQEAGVQVIAGDTKVVQKGKGDGLYINTTGIGILQEGLEISGANAKPGDAILLSGTIGDHGMAVLCARGELGFEGSISSDVAPLNHMIAALLEAVGPAVHVMRDPTRGGLATTLNEIASQSQTGMVIQEQAIPVNPAVQAACELLGFDPLYVANEGKLIVIVEASQAERALHALRASPYGRAAQQIGEVTSSAGRRVLLKTAIGTSRVVDVLAGEMLPRIC